MEDRHDEPLSTADLAEPGREDDTTERQDRELRGSAADRGAARESTDGRYDEPGAQGADQDETTPLFDQGQADGFQSEWESIQTGFVDEPRRAVERADALVADLMRRLATSFAQERNRLEAQWDRGDDVSTEDLRLSLRRYRSFFTRLLRA